MPGAIAVQAVLAIPTTQSVPEASPVHAELTAPTAFTVRTIPKQLSPDMPEVLIQAHSAEKPKGLASSGPYCTARGIQPQRARIVVMAVGGYVLVFWLLGGEKTGLSHPISPHHQGVAGIRDGPIFSRVTEIPPQNTRKSGL